MTDIEFYRVAVVALALLVVLAQLVRFATQASQKGTALTLKPGVSRDAGARAVAQVLILKKLEFWSAMGLAFFILGAQMLGDATGTPDTREFLWLVAAAGTAYIAITIALVVRRAMLKAVVRTRLELAAAADAEVPIDDHFHVSTAEFWRTQAIKFVARRSIV